MSQILKRSLARMTDVFIWLFFWNLIYFYVFRGSANKDFAMLFVDQYVAIFLMFLSETFFIARFGTTIGKSILGLSVVHSQQGKLNLKQSFMRSFRIWRYVFGYGVPYYQLVCLVRAWHNRKDQESGVFESAKDGMVVRSKKLSIWHWIILVVTISFLMTVLWYFYFVAWKSL